MSKILNFYLNSLSKRPKTTNAIMTGSLFGLGDVSAQLFFSHSEYPVEKGAETPSANILNTVKHYDFPRTARAVIYGSLIFSFIGDKWYKILRYKVKIPNKGNSDWANRLLRVSVDQLAFAPLSLPFYFGCMTTMEGHSLDVAKKKINDQWWSTLKTNWTVWPLFQAINFSFVPLQHQLLAVNVVAIFWNTYLSYKNSITTSESKKRPVHYPPVVE
ncbi:protein Sym1p [Monosporozyma servazzii]